MEHGAVVLTSCRVMACWGRHVCCEEKDNYWTAGDGDDDDATRICLRCRWHVSPAGKLVATYVIESCMLE